jgi:hypothetical protein
MSTSTEYETSVKLTDGNKWHKWYQAYLSLAETGGILKICSLKQDHKPEDHILEYLTDSDVLFEEYKKTTLADDKAHNAQVFETTKEEIDKAVRDRVRNEMIRLYKTDEHLRIEYNRLAMINKRLYEK